jgi:hypothetical protein
MLPSAVPERVTRFRPTRSCLSQRSALCECWPRRVAKYGIWVSCNWRKTHQSCGKSGKMKPCCINTIKMIKNSTIVSVP